jgi:Uma2 family endonuclease
MATLATKSMTADQFYEWACRTRDNGKLYELDEGKVVELPTPGELHGAICGLIVYLLTRYVIQRGRGYVCSNDTGLLVKRKPGTVRGPDIMLFDENRPLRKLSRKFSERIPKLVVEVWSPSDQMAKVNRRISQYLKRGVPLVWLVHPDTSSVTVYRSGKDFRVLQEADELTGEDVLPKLRFRVAEFFALPGRE